MRLFQQHVLNALEAYAKTSRDDTWKQRLWLALATNLMSLVDKQTDQRYATVVYVEAVKLPDELFADLDGKKRPPSMLLACSPDDLEDPAGLAEARETGSAPKTVLRVTDQVQGRPVLDLVRQAYQLIF